MGAVCLKHPRLIGDRHDHFPPRLENSVDFTKRLGFVRNMLDDFKTHYDIDRFGSKRNHVPVVLYRDNCLKLIGLEIIVERGEVGVVNIEGDDLASGPKELDGL